MKAIPFVYYDSEGNRIVIGSGEADIVDEGVILVKGIINDDSPTIRKINKTNIKYLNVVDIGAAFDETIQNSPITTPVLKFKGSI